MPVESKFKVGSRTPPRRVIMQVVGGFVPFRVCGLRLLKWDSQKGLALAAAKALYI